MTHLRCPGSQARRAEDRTRAEAEEDVLKAAKAWRASVSEYDGLSGPALDLLRSVDDLARARRV